MNKKFKKAAAIVIAVCLCISTGVLTVGALSNADRLNGQTADHLYLQDGTNQIVKFDNTENFFGDYAYNEEVGENIIVPGYNRTTTATLENQSEKTVNLYMLAVQEPSTARFQAYRSKNPEFTANKTAWRLARESDEILKLVKVKVEYTPEFDDAENGYSAGVPKTIYEGDMSGKAVSGGTGSMGKTIPLGTYANGTKGTLTITYSLDPSYGNEIAGRMAMIDWVFQAREVNKPTVTPPPPGTGEASIPFVIGAALCALSATAIIFLLFRQKRREEEA